MINIDNFIKQNIIKRNQSLFFDDLKKLNKILFEKTLDKTVLVIGGAGTIGSSYIKALLKFKIKTLVVVDTNENGLTELVRDLRSSNKYNIPEKFITYPIDFGDIVFDKIFKSHGSFHIVANFAAHKHVRSEKDIFSIEAMLRNNVFKARKLLDLLVEFPPQHFFCVSTDKAANPVNIMGASKKLMEELILSYSTKIPIKTARFANVAFSNGSLLQGFLERLYKSQPWSCPLGIRRFFVSPQESGELCLIACIMGQSGDIFYPKLNVDDMILFDQIALDLLNFLNLNAKVCISENEAINASQQIAENPKDYPIYFFESETSGEKTFEEFYTEKETLDTNTYEKLGVIKNSKIRTVKEINSFFKELENIFSTDDLKKSDVVNVLKSFLLNFDHFETGKNLDQKM